MTVFEKLAQVLAFGCAYERIADEYCSATILRRRRDEWIETGVIEALREVAPDPTYETEVEGLLLSARYL